MYEILSYALLVFLVALPTAVIAHVLVAAFWKHK